MNNRTPALVAFAFCLSPFTMPAQAQVIGATHLLEPGSSAPNDRMGTSADMDDDTVVIGAAYRPVAGVASGVAFLYDAETGQYVHRLVPNDGADGDQFGWSVGISGARIVVGAQNDDDLGEGSGSAYLFHIGSMSPDHKLLPSDGTEGDLFGRSVAIDRDFTILGAPGWDGGGPRNRGRLLVRLLYWGGADETHGERRRGHRRFWRVGCRGAETSRLSGHPEQTRWASRPAPLTFSM